MIFVPIHKAVQFLLLWGGSPPPDRPQYRRRIVRFIDLLIVSVQYNCLKTVGLVLTAPMMWWLAY